MAKYSTGSSNSTNNLDNGICEICSSKGKLSKIGISGTTVIVCPDCKRKHKKKKNNSDKKSTDSNNWQDYATTTEPDNSWVEESRPDYGNATTPYLVNKYSKLFEEALYEKNISKDELVNEIELDSTVIEYILNGNAIRNNVTKNQISKIESYLDIQLQE